MDVSDTERSDGLVVENRSELVRGAWLAWLGRWCAVRRIFTDVRRSSISFSLTEKLSI